MYGTDITRALRKAKFDGLIFICSANDECNSVKHYLAAGATGSLLKTPVYQELVADIIRQSMLGFRAGLQAEISPRSLPMKSVTANLDFDGSTLVDQLHLAGGSISS